MSFKAGEEYRRSALAIEEDESMPEQPEATVMRGRVTMSGLGLTIQTEVNGAQISFERLVDATIGPEDLDAEIDMLYARVHRQKAKAVMRKMLLDMAEAQLTIDAGDAKLRAVLKERVTLRAQVRASFEAAWQTKGKRTDYIPSVQDKATLDQFDRETEAKKAEHERKMDEARLAMPFFTKELTKLYRQIHGDDPVDNWEPPAELAEAAE